MVNVNISKTPLMDNYQINEAYKMLRTNVQFCGSDIKVIAITSCTPNEGKSSVSFSLATSIAETGKRVLFIDADLRKSVMLGRFRVTQYVKGLTHLLSGQCGLGDVLCSTNIENLFMIFSGPTTPNPAELLESDKFKQLIETVHEDFDYVIIDTPPLGSVIDSAIISRRCNGIIFVLEANAISYKFAQHVVKSLEKTECRILGTVLNKVKIHRKGYYGKYYGKHYGKYYGQEYK